MLGTLEPLLSPPTSGDFAIGQDQLAAMSRDHNVEARQQYGGARLSELLRTNLEKGIQVDDADLLKRKSAFGSNTYPPNKGRSFWMFLWEAWQDLTLIILIVAAVASSVQGIKTEVVSIAWHD
ncbi:calcium-transporting atpase 10, plasma membrane-type [Fagus crenata]